MKSKKAFTMVELIFVIVIIGILSAVAIPKFADTADSAYLTKAKDTLSTVRNALMTERQKRVLRGSFVSITDLSLKADGTASTNVFDHFSSDGRVPAVYAPLFEYPNAGCSGVQKACWTKTSNAPATYAYRFPDASMGVDGQAEFVITNNKFVCKDAAEEADCNLILF